MPPAMASPLLQFSGDPDNVRPAIKKFGGDVSTVNVIEPDRSPDRHGYADTFYQLRKHKGVDEKSAESAVSDPLIFADLMVREGDAAGSLGGPHAQPRMWSGQPFR